MQLTLFVVEPHAHLVVLVVGFGVTALLDFDDHSNYKKRFNKMKKLKKERTYRKIETQRSQSPLDDEVIIYAVYM